MELYYSIMFILNSEEYNEVISLLYILINPPHIDVDFFIFKIF